MPSYRLVLTVGEVRLPLPFDDVLPTVANIVATYATVEHRDLAIRQGQPHIVIRFTGTSDAHARSVCDSASLDIDTLIEVREYHTEVLHRGRGRIIGHGQVQRHESFDDVSRS